MVIVYLLNVDVILGTRLKQLNIHLIRESLGIRWRHDFAGWLIIFVADQHLAHQIAMLLHFRKPASDRWEGVSVLDIVDYDDSMSSSVVPSFIYDLKSSRDWKAQQIEE